jgi:chorismate-pyruvate lyase
MVTLGGDKPWLWGLTVMLPASRRPWLQPLQQVGDQPLGTLLFETMKARRVAKSITLLTAGACFAGLWPGQAPQENALWARQSLFEVAGELVYLAEVLLPDCPST